MNAHLATVAQGPTPLGRLTPAGLDLGGGLVLPEARACLRWPSEATWSAAARGRYLGASGAAKALSASPYAGPWEVWRWHTAATVPPRQDSATLRVGNREEPRILADYAEDYRVRVLPTRYLRIIGAETWQAFTPDALIFDGEWGGGECKVDRSPFRWGPSGTVIDAWSAAALSVVRLDYAIQCYASMMWSGLPWWRLLVRREVGEINVYTLRRDLVVERKLATALAAFWAHVETRTPPPVDGSEGAAAIAAQLAVVGDESRAATPEEDSLISEYLQARQEADAATSRQNAASARLALGMAGARRIVGPSGRAVMVRGSRPHLRIT